MKYPFLTKLAGNFKRNPGSAKLNWFAEILIEEAFEGIPKDAYLDCHTHIMGLGTGGTGCWMNPGILTWKHPLDHLKVMFYINGSAIDDMRYADQQYVQRFLTQVYDFPQNGKFILLALDGAYNKDGAFSRNDTKFYVPNEYIYKTYQSDPENFVPCISVHPYREDAIDELEKWAKLGVRAVKWLPNAMGMDPSDPVCEPFYEKMKEYDMVLLSHVGGESAIEVLKFRPLGNPLLFRKPLDMGVKVIMAHCASSGINLDLESNSLKPMSNFKLFMRLMEEPKYEKLLFADISALTQINRSGTPLSTMLERTDLHHRLINGSDYPLPAINAVISTRFLELMGYISRRERVALNQIYKRNPLLFDFVLKRTLKAPGDKITKFSDSIFMDNILLKLTQVQENAGQLL
ncbi:amidohydrolase 2 [Flammeovirgaceae bacterium 311]|nr:amidohydrolase 2 [Flammeovirgaceae bacterium 311]